MDNLIKINEMDTNTYPPNGVYVRTVTFSKAKSYECQPFRYSKEDNNWYDLEDNSANSQDMTPVAWIDEIK